MMWDSIRKGQEQNINVILGANFPVNAPLNSLGMTALHFAACSGTEQILQLLLSFGADINARDQVQITFQQCNQQYGRTPLHMAAANNYMLALNLLLGLPGIDINAQSNGGETPLHKAVQFSSREAIRRLIESGANLLLLNASGINAVQFAQIMQTNDLYSIMQPYLTPQNYPPMFYLQQQALQSYDSIQSFDDGDIQMEESKGY